LLPVALGAVPEQKRIMGFKERGHRWPPIWQPESSKGWTAVMERREQQARCIKNSQQRWDAFVMLAQAGVIVPNYTRLGFGVAEAPAWVNAKLQASLDRYLVHKQVRGEEENRATEADDREILAIVGANRPLFVDQEDLSRETLLALQPMHEAWAGVKLVPEMAYGLRIYRDGAQLLMHYDKVETHVISSILHVGHDNASEPWPIVIEGLDGQTHEVVLKEGQMLFYESSKCLHGRPRPFKGSYYSSIFVHYRPVDYRLTKEEVEYAVALDFVETNLCNRSSGLPELELRSTGIREPICPPTHWCALGVDSTTDSEIAAEMTSSARCVGGTLVSWLIKEWGHNCWSPTDSNRRTVIAKADAVSQCAIAVYQNEECGHAFEFDNATGFCGCGSRGTANEGCGEQRAPGRIRSSSHTLVLHIAPQGCGRGATGAAEL